VLDLGQVLVDESHRSQLMLAWTGLPSRTVSFTICHRRGFGGGTICGDLKFKVLLQKCAEDCKNVHVTASLGLYLLFLSLVHRRRGEDAASPRGEECVCNIKNLMKTAENEEEYLS
jgi:hypothetical protein